MKLPKEFKIIDLGLIYKDNLIISDLQLGYEQQIQNKGILIPKFQLKDITKRLNHIFSKIKVKRIIINGDLKHEFGRINRQEWDDTIGLFDYLAKNVEEIILIKGNHDMILNPLAKKRNLEVKDFWEDEKVLIIHGHKIPEKLNKTIIIGHEHPAISFLEKPTEKFKCFLVGKYKRKNLIVMPSFNDITQGSDIRNSKNLSPFLEKGTSNFDCYVIDDEGSPKYFGKVKDLLKLQ